jgi:hypothetical protein
VHPVEIPHEGLEDTIHLDLVVQEAKERISAGPLRWECDVREEFADLHYQPVGGVVAIDPDEAEVLGAYRR